MKRRSLSAYQLFDLGTASAETITRRVMLMATGKCSHAEYRKMVNEKAAAAGHSWLEAAMFPWTAAYTMLEPWRRAARRNAVRLRRKR